MRESMIMDIMRAGNLQQVVRERVPSRRKPEPETFTLRQLRMRSFLSIRGLARETGMAPSTIQNLEAGKIRNPHPETIKDLAGLFAVDPSQIRITYSQK